MTTTLTAIVLAVGVFYTMLSNDETLGIKLTHLRLMAEGVMLDWIANLNR